MPAAGPCSRLRPPRHDYPNLQGRICEIPPEQSCTQLHRNEQRCAEALAHWRVQQVPHFHLPSTVSDYRRTIRSVAHPPILWFARPGEQILHHQAAPWVNVFGVVVVTARVGGTRSHVDEQLVRQRQPNLTKCCVGVALDRAPDERRVDLDPCRVAVRGVPGRARPIRAAEFDAHCALARRHIL